MHEPIHKRPVTPWTVGKTYREADAEAQAMRDVRSAIGRLYEVLEPKAANFYATLEIINADREANKGRWS